jgi:hypothetical protein
MGKMGKMTFFHPTNLFSFIINLIRTLGKMGKMI